MKDNGDKLIESFSFLKNHESFLYTNISETTVDFFYEWDEVNDYYGLKYESYISIPFSPESQIIWDFQEENSDYRKQYRNINITPEWFLTFYEYAVDKHRKRNRIRKLFNSNDDKKVGIDDFFEELSNRLNNKGL